MAASIFISYSHADERVLERLHKHLAMLQRDGLVSAWYDRAILPGAGFSADISQQLNASDVFVALVSPDYLASNYCYDKEFERALARNERGEMRIVPVIAEPCDWLPSPLQQFMALPKDGKPISEWTNANTAYLDVVNGLRRLVTAPAPAHADGAARLTQAEEPVRRVRLKRDFDVIEKAEFADRAFATMRGYFRDASAELASASEDLRTRFEEMSPTAFTCTIVNRARRGNQDAHITVHNRKGGGFFGDITYINAPHADGSTSNGAVRVEVDDYDLFLTTDPMFGMRGDETGKMSPERAAEWLWNEFVERAGVQYE